MAPVDQELKSEVQFLHQQVGELADTVRRLRKEVVSQVKVSTFAEQLQAEGGSGEIDAVVEDDLVSPSLAVENASVQRALQHLRSKMKHLVDTARDLDEELPACLAGSERELDAASHVLSSLSSNVDRAMAHTSTIIEASRTASETRADGKRSEEAVGRLASRGRVVAGHGVR